MAWQMYDPSGLQDMIQDPFAARPLPINDHTSDALGSGYVYAQMKDNRPNATALMTSRLYEALTPADNNRLRCIQFYYYLEIDDSMGAAGASALNVSVF